MKVLVDTNVFVASLTDEPARGDVATEFLNQDHDFCTSILNLMEIRSVMTKKKRVEQGRVEDVLSDIYTRVDIYAPEISDQISAYSLQQDTLLYTLDCVLLALADDLNATLATFDGELRYGWFGSTTGTVCYS
ncbi:type II toxin-antitoxin system VapC family toxin [Halosegnis rubeus]|jgi:predicted nucleic acid-binding protein|uniref:Ribonuclease VapC n=1 Tax=Halosegnis rubeus TaxID=2212850 RepID=A0A5N5U6G1_9EURY|nr:PIN domain-containing protein [Halosegnis rubeus]KAB7514153.1 PIN domain-containing protein [Halosegnis rubeus]